jgi:hypothetical protein
MASTWPLPVSATNPIPDRAPLAPVHVTVHSIVFVPAEARMQHDTCALQQITGYTERTA